MVGTSGALRAEAEQSLEKRIAEFHSIRLELLADILAEAGIEDPADWAAKAFSQSQLFAAEILPLMHRLYEPEPVNIEKTFLDIGPSNFAGTQLIQSIHQALSYTKLKLRVSALDIHGRYSKLQQFMVPECEFIISDLYKVSDRSWDMILASHVIEHVPDPEKFIHKMQDLAVDYVIIAAPWNENPIVTKSHINTIDKKLVRRVRGRDLRIFTNYAWGKDREVCTFWVPGRARSL
jgi:Methyltransferase domain